MNMNSNNTTQLFLVITLKRSDYLEQIDDDTWWNKVKGTFESADGSKVCFGDFDPDTGEWIDDSDDPDSEFRVGDWVQCIDRESSYYGWRGQISQIQTHQDCDYGHETQWALVEGVVLEDYQLAPLKTEARRVKWGFRLGEFVVVPELDLYGFIAGFIPGVPAYVVTLAPAGYLEIEASKVCEVAYRF